MALEDLVRRVVNEPPQRRPDANMDDDTTIAQAASRVVGSLRAGAGAGKGANSKNIPSPGAASGSKSYYHMVRARAPAPSSGSSQPWHPNNAFRHYAYKKSHKWAWKPEGGAPQRLGKGKGGSRKPKGKGKAWGSGK